MRRLFCFLALTVAVLLGGCGKPDFSDAEKKTIASLALNTLPALKPDTTNRFADVPAAAALGSTLFFDVGMSRDGTVSCSTCHKIDRQFQDDLPQAVGVGRTNRRTMPLAGVARDPWFFWDGRRDSLWAQALTPLENPLEQAGNRTAYAHYMKARFGERYERIFGPLPDFSGVPLNASPLGSDTEKAAWNAMSDAQRDAINSVYANIGKAIAAFERSIEPTPTRFDRFALDLATGAEPKGDAAFSREEILGLKLFIGKANCVTCHNGPRFTDNGFHNTGVPPVAGLPADRGRVEAVAQVEADPFNCFGAYRDGEANACGELRFMVKDAPELVRAYKTPSLRGAATRPPYMHAGQFSSLDEVVAHYAKAAPSVEGVSEVHPLELSDRERAALVAFLKTLSE
ncbi:MULTISPECIES: cytochrome c peroxidase [unclassified Mesorhizobium]|uniref:cytochrome-c peroxidase n=1 Tax=unclassified Mesorhizobium TaxID=325217 RepID=UPI000FDBBA83|nr:MULTISPECIES: cytochrome c peroxidase [unclassified Mesorhizobium]TGR38821.1 c-type cytochrome [bacterium M00.F.Ca.ET.199.01.1.1]TGU27433.1 c-type cytochrome [bacterium M00.F.Ca.ET.156.01.1.1]TGV83857.1 c-type cytochrome [Mesorhizobium sp. M00.F.Ca.ET.149.01.1.1]TGR20547.1 c-type cytochrome [Mesorhizobium sp. M8A.F.Ca.ET.202.01.1.1]TGR22585.1 c-type cytochrome [Mesorhizobium sp. M8A.F.Ca.ET.197.01.1.1]